MESKNAQLRWRGHGAGYKAASRSHAGMYVVRRRKKGKNPWSVYYAPDRASLGAALVFLGSAGTFRDVKPFAENAENDEKPTREEKDPWGQKRRRREELAQGFRKTITTPKNVGGPRTRIVWKKAQISERDSWRSRYKKLPALAWQNLGLAGGKKSARLIFLPTGQQLAPITHWATGYRALASRSQIQCLAEMLVAEIPGFIKLRSKSFYRHAVKVDEIRADWERRMEADPQIWPRRCAKWALKPTDPGFVSPERQTPDFFRGSRTKPKWERRLFSINREGRWETVLGLVWLNMGISGNTLTHLPTGLRISGIPDPVQQKPVLVLKCLAFMLVRDVPGFLQAETSADFAELAPGPANVLKKWDEWLQKGLSASPPGGCRQFETEAAKKTRLALVASRKKASREQQRGYARRMREWDKQRERWNEQRIRDASVRRAADEFTRRVKEGQVPATALAAVTKTVESELEGISLGMGRSNALTEAFAKVRAPVRRKVKQTLSKLRRGKYRPRAETLRKLLKEHAGVGGKGEKDYVALKAQLEKLKK